MSLIASWHRLLLTTMLLAGIGLVPTQWATSSLAASPDIVISQIYAADNSDSSPMPYDYIELFNPTAQDVTVDGWSVQYASDTGKNWKAVVLGGVIPAGGHYLVRGNGRWDTLGAFPRPDAVGPLNLSSNSGKVALVVPGISLTCGETPDDCLPDDAIRDFVGYGPDANSAEGGQAAPMPGATMAIQRAAPGTDSDVNAADFVLALPAPQTSGIPGATCEAGDIPEEAVPIRTIQGADHRSPVEGEVRVVRGIVTGVQDQGFFLQDPTPDGDPATSEGLFVFTPNGPCVVAGDAVTVRGKVKEYRAGDPTNLTKTELVNAETWWQSERNPLPLPVVLGLDGLMPPTEVIDNDGVLDVEADGTFDPGGDALDFYESLEGMLVQIDDAVVVGPRSRGDDGWIPVLVDDGAGASVRTGRGGIVARAGDANPERIIIDDDIIERDGGTTPVVAVGDHLLGTMLGVVDYDLRPGDPDLSRRSGAYRVQVLAPPGAPLQAHLERESGPALAPGELAIATFNVHNLAGDAEPEVFERLADVIVHDLHAPQIIALQEVQDNDGTKDNGSQNVDAATTYAKLIAAITALDATVVYEPLEIAPQFGQEGGAGEGKANIRVAVLYRISDEQDLPELVTRPGANATTENAVDCVDDRPSLTYSPGRIDPTNPVFANSRKPLAVEFTLGNRPLFVIANHFASKLGDRSAYGLDQVSALESEATRVSQAGVVRAFTDEILACDSQAMVVVLGDLNDYAFSPAVLALSEGDSGMTNLITELPEAEQYTYVHEGNSQAIDHIVVSDVLLDALVAIDPVHRHAEYPWETKDASGETIVRASDHDPVVAVFALMD